MSNLLIKAGTALRLGTPNLGRVAFYKIGLKSGLNPVRRLDAALPVGPFFNKPTRLADEQAVPRSGWFRQSEAFGAAVSELGRTPPLWNSSLPEGETWRLLGTVSSLGKLLNLTSLF